MSYLEQSVAKLKHFEGVVPWLYLDTVGKVTVGVGFMLPTVLDALKLPFLLGERPATQDEIILDYNRVSKRGAGQRPNFYHGTASVTLSPEFIDQNLQATVQRFEVYLRDDIKGYDSFPDPAKIALIDMAYNLGPVGLLTKYPHLLAAVKVQNWPLCAVQCHRNGPSAERNAWTAQTFASAGAA